jgi:hypothetical protein
VISPLATASSIFSSVVRVSGGGGGGVVVPPPAGPGAWAVGGEAFFLHFFFAFFLHFFLAACAGGPERSCATAAVEQAA